ncbi:hypothetical protein PHOSAC3_120245 [Mesotoga infera]|nr:hypothetical protein PHOSAC3_120245 [Mesotoga infera]
MTIKDYCEKAISRHSDNGPSQNLGLLGERTVLSSDQRVFVIKGMTVLSCKIPYRSSTG